MEDFLDKKGFKIIFWNTRSVIKKIDGIRCKIHAHLPNIVAISESWFKTNIPNSLVEITGYNIHRQDRTLININGHEKRDGGLLVYIRNDLNYDQLPGDILK